MRPDALAVLGLDALGASAARRARLAGVSRVVGWSPSRAEGVAALRQEAVHDVADRLDRALAGASLVLVSLPFTDLLALLPRLLVETGPGALVGVISPLQLPLRRALSGPEAADRVVGMHPFVSQLQAAPGAGPADPWPGLLTYVCGAESDAGHQSARAVMSFLEEVLGAAPVLIEATRHDEQVAWTRAIAPAAAAILAHLLESRRLGGVSWDRAAADATRAVPGDRAGWAAVLVANRGPVEAALGKLGDETARLRALIAAGDRAGVERFLSEASAFRPAVR